MRYKRNYINGGCYFFTVVTYKRKRIFNSTTAVDKLRHCFKKVMINHPFSIDAFVLLPDHLHCIWSLPEGDSNFSIRWQLIKSTFTRSAKAEKGSVWQNRYWEHTLRDEDDYKNHIDYIHYNPVKHQLAEAPFLWPYSSFHRCVKNGLYDKQWGAGIPIEFDENTGKE